MKKEILLVCGSAVFALSGLHAQVLVSNGGFETVTGGSPHTFAETDDWTNRIGDQTLTAGVDASAMTGSVVGIVDDRFNTTTDTFGITVQSQDTGYVITSGDSFDFSFDWLDSTNWDDALDEVRLVVYATDDNTVDGTEVWSSIHNSGTSTANNTVETVSGTSSIVTSGAVGQSLFVNIFGFENDGTPGGSRGFAAIDEISVTAVPEPSAAALLLGLTGMALVLRRRR